MPYANPTSQSARASRAAYARAWRAANRERFRATARRRYRRNRDKMLEATRRWRAENPEAVKKQKAAWNAANKDRVRASENARRLRAFGMTVEAHAAMYAAQDGRCAICRRPEADFKRKLSVDHDHLTGAVRGLLCGPCNAMLGHARDAAHILRAGIEYLDNSKPKFARAG